MSDFAKNLMAGIYANSPDLQRVDKELKEKRASKFSVGDKVKVTEDIVTISEIKKGMEFTVGHIYGPNAPYDYRLISEDEERFHLNVYANEIEGA